MISRLLFMVGDVTIDTKAVKYSNRRTCSVTQGETGDKGTILYAKP